MEKAKNRIYNLERNIKKISLSINVHEKDKNCKIFIKQDNVLKWNYKIIKIILTFYNYESFWKN
jgi:hypothetical protein